MGRPRTVQLLAIEESVTVIVAEKNHRRMVETGVLNLVTLLLEAIDKEVVFDRIEASIVRIVSHTKDTARHEGDCGCGSVLSVVERSQLRRILSYLG